MASKFQNRLVGTVILVALGVIVLPGLLDGEKKHYEDRFAAIPLVPKPGDPQENEGLPPITQPLQPPEGAAAALEQASQGGAENPVDERPAEPIAPPVTMTTPPPQQVKPVEPKPAVSKPAEVKPEVKPEPKPEVKPEPKPEVILPPKAEPKPPTEKPPVGQAYVVQLGALKNAAKVNEIVAQLRLSGYRVFTVPSTPVQGQLTRIFVGPDASRQKLESALPELRSLSSLQGQILPYSGR